MTPRRVLAFACIALLSSTLAAQTPAPQKTQEDEEFLKGAYLTTITGVKAPKVVHEVRPSYTSDAMRRKIVGEVQLQIVVGTTGRVERARVTKSLDKVYGLDASALEAVSRWRFQPGLLDGFPVPVAVDVELAFKLHSCGPSGCGSVPSQSQVPVQKPAEDDEFLKGVYAVGATGVLAPTVVKEAKPSYTPQAMREKIQGEVELQIVVGVDGRVARARITKSLDKDYGLDPAALEAAMQWTFKPGTLNGEPVPVVVVLNLAFRLGR